MSVPGCIPTLPLKQRVDLGGIISLDGGRNVMGALKNLLVEGKSYHQM